MKLFLFDIDGTLINSGGSGKQSINIVFKKFFNIQNVADNIHIQGRSDKAIWEDVIKKFNIPWSDFLRIKPILLKEYYKTLNEIMKNNINKKIYSNVKEILNLLQQTGHKLGLVTGNLKKSAYIKISFFDIGQFFPIGGFGNDSEYRDIIVRKAVLRAKKFYSYKFSNEEIFVVGDTPADIESAAANNVISVAITTGYHTYTELVKYNPDYIFDNMKQLKTLI